MRKVVFTLACWAVAIPAAAPAAGLLVDVRLSRSPNGGYSYDSLTYQFATHEPNGGPRLHFKDGTYSYGPPSASPVEALSVTGAGAAARAYADLSRGKLGVYAGTDDDTRAYAQALMDETLTFSIAGATASTVTPLRMLISTHAATAATVFVFGFVAESASLSHLGALSAPYYTANQNWAAYSTYTVGTTRYWDVTYNLRGANPSIPIRLDLRAQAERGGIADLGHTAGINLMLPQGVTFTSSSGQFLAAVPEPASWALLIGGFSMLGSAMRRWRAGVATVTA